MDGSNLRGPATECLPRAARSLPKRFLAWSTKVATGSGTDDGLAWAMTESTARTVRKQTFDLNVRFSADYVRFGPKSGRIDTVTVESARDPKGTFCLPTQRRCVIHGEFLDFRGCQIGHL